MKCFNSEKCQVQHVMVQNYGFFSVCNLFFTNLFSIFITKIIKSYIFYFKNTKVVNVVQY